MKILTIILIMMSLFINGQSYFSFIKKNSDENKLLLKTNLYDYTRLNRLNSITYNIIFEFPIYKKFTVNSYLGFIHSSGIQNSTYAKITHDNSRGFGGGLEVRYYIGYSNNFDEAPLFFKIKNFLQDSENFNNTGLYLGINNYFERSNIVRSECSNIVYSNCTDTFRTKQLFLFVIGYQTIKKYGLVIDTSFGFGRRIVYSPSMDILHTELQIKNLGGFLGEIRYDTDKIWNNHFHSNNLNLKFMIGWRF